MPTIYAALRDALLVVRGDPGRPRADRRLTDRHLQCVASHPDSPERVLCGTANDGLLLSEDGGETWRRVGGDLLADMVTAVAVNPRDPSEWWAGTEPSAVYRSADGGESWIEREGLTDLPSALYWSFPPRPYTHHVRWIEPDPVDSQHLYVSIEAGALVQTHDGGQTWADRVPSGRRDNHSLATHPDAPGRAYAAAGDGYAETADGGETWTYPQEGLDHRYCWSVVSDPTDPDTVLLSAASGPRSAHTPASAESYVYRKSGDEPWERLDDLPTGEGVLRPVLDAGDDAGEFYALSNRGLFRSTDAGNSWGRLDVPWEEAYRRQTPNGLIVT